MQFGGISAKLVMEKEKFPRQIPARLVREAAKLLRLLKLGLIALLVAVEGAFQFRIWTFARLVAVGVAVFYVIVVAGFLGGLIKPVVEYVLDVEDLLQATGLLHVHVVMALEQKRKHRLAHAPHVVAAAADMFHLQAQKLALLATELERFQIPKHVQLVMVQEY